MLISVYQEWKLYLLSYAYILVTFSRVPAGHFRCMGKFLHKMSQVILTLPLSSVQSHIISQQSVVEQFVSRHGDQMQSLVSEFN